MNALRTIVNNIVSYHIGSYYIMPISEEEYTQIKQIKPESTIEDGKRYIIYMKDFPSDVLAGFAKRIIEYQRNTYGVDIQQVKQQIEALKRTIIELELSINYLEDLQNLTNSVKK